MMGSHAMMGKPCTTPPAAAAAACSTDWCVSRILCCSCWNSFLCVSAGFPNDQITLINKTVKKVLVLSMVIEFTIACRCFGSNFTVLVIS